MGFGEITSERALSTALGLGSVRNVQEHMSINVSQRAFQHNLTLESDVLQSLNNTCIGFNLADIAYLQQTQCASSSASRVTQADT
jgi:hypothetical protein